MSGQDRSLDTQAKSKSYQIGIFEADLVKIGRYRYLDLKPQNNHLLYLLGDQ